MIALAAWSPALAKIGIIELGVAGQNAGLSTFQAIIEGQVFTEGSHVMGESSASIAEKIRANIDASPAYVATIDPNQPTAIQVLKLSSANLTTLEVFIDDPNIGGTFVDSSDSPGLSATVRGADGVAGNGNFEIDITVVCSGMPPALYTQVVSTVGKTTKEEVNAAMVAALTANGFTVVGPTNGPWTITHPLGRLQRTEMKRTDTGIHISGVKQDTTATTTGSIPTLSEWGLIALVTLLAGVAVTLLRRRTGGPVEPVGP